MKNIKNYAKKELKVNKFHNKMIQKNMIVY